jgi:hypothetical protein
VTRHILIQLLAAISVACGLVFTGGTAQAETNPACPSGVTKIGTTGYVKIGDAMFASVKQFKGCGLNWGYIYVWKSWRDTHSRWDMCIGIRDAEHVVIGLVCAVNSARAELWSEGTATLQECTSAVGWYGTGTNLISGGSSSRVC